MSKKVIRTYCISTVYQSSDGVKFKNKRRETKITHTKTRIGNFSIGRSIETILVPCN